MTRAEFERANAALAGHQRLQKHSKAILALVAATFGLCVATLVVSAYGAFRTASRIERLEAAVLGGTQ